MLDLVLSYKKKNQTGNSVWRMKPKPLTQVMIMKTMLHNQGCSDIKIRSVPRGYEKSLDKAA